MWWYYNRYMNIEKIIWIKFRIIMSVIFLWAFFDKLFGLGFATKPEKAWIEGASPTYGFLTNGTYGPFADFFKSLAGLPVVDWMFMLGLLFVGVTFLMNRFILLGAIAGSTMMLLMWLAAFPPQNNPLIDDHIVYIFALLVVAIQSRKTRKRSSIERV